MKFFRGLIALLFAGILVFGLVKWYQQDYSTRDKYLFAPVREKIATLVQPRGERSTSDVPVVKNNNGTNDNKQLHPDVTQGTLPLKAYNSLVQGARVLGNTKSSLVMVVFCDYAVGYCKDLHDSGSIYDYQKILGNDLAIIWKPFPKSPTSATLSSHRAYLCTEKTASEDQLLEYLQFLFQQESYSDDALIMQATTQKIPGFEQCFIKQRAQLNEYIQTQRQLTKTTVGLTALPTLLIYNTSTQERYKIPGRYELDEIAPTFEYINEMEQ